MYLSLLTQHLIGRDICGFDESSTPLALALVLFVLQSGIPGEDASADQSGRQLLASSDFLLQVLATGGGGGERSEQRVDEVELDLGHNENLCCICEEIQFRVKIFLIKMPQTSN